jgi:hypothetical protein
MAGPLPDLVQGRLGRVTFDHLNTVFRTVDRVNRERMAAVNSGTVLRSFIAQLDATASTFDGYQLWEWSQVRVGTTAVETNASLLDDSKFGAADGLAIQIDGGTANANDLVVMHEFVAVDGKRWFAFSRPPGSSTDSAVMLRITSSTSIGTNRWEYEVTEATINGSGTASDVATTGDAFNTYELPPWGNGQDLTQTNGTLVPGPVQGYVTGKRISTGLYVFHAPNPMDTECSA